MLISKTTFVKWHLLSSYHKEKQNIDAGGLRSQQKPNNYATQQKKTIKNHNYYCSTNQCYSMQKAFSGPCEERN